MTDNLKKFIEYNIDLIQQNHFEQLFLQAYEDALMTSEVLDLHNILLDSDIFDSTMLRNDLLYKMIEQNLEFIRLRHPQDLNTNNMSFAETYVVQFLRRYLNNCFGFLEGQAVQFMWDNQDNFNIKLTLKDKIDGQGNYPNYHIEYV